MLVTLVTTSKAKKMASKAKKSSFLLSPGSSFCWTPAIIIKMATESHQAMVQASRVQSRRKWKQSSSLGSHHHLPEKDKSFYNFPFLEEEPIVFFIAKIIKKLLRMRAFSFFESLYEIAEDKSALMGLYYSIKMRQIWPLSNTVPREVLKQLGQSMDMTKKGLLCRTHFLCTKRFRKVSSPPPERSKEGSIIKKRHLPPWSRVFQFITFSRRHHARRKA